MAETVTGLELDYIEQDSLAEPIIQATHTEIEINLDETLTLFMEEAEEHLATIHQFWIKSYISMTVTML